MVSLARPRTFAQWWRENHHERLAYADAIKPIAERAWREAFMEGYQHCVREEISTVNHAPEVKGN